MNLKLAWRNIWRNKKRAYITISMVMFAVLLATFMRSFQEGSYNGMIDNSIGQFTGYIQIHNIDYWDDKTIDNGFEIDNDLTNQIIKYNDNIIDLIPRLESFALISHNNNIKGSIILGIDPEKEDQMSHIRDKIVEGDFITNDDRAILVAEGLASFLNVKIGDTLVLISQGHYGQSAIDAIPVKGIVKFPAPTINKGLIYMPLPFAREFYSFPSGITSLVVSLKNTKKSKETSLLLNEKLKDDNYSAKHWQDISPELHQQIESDRGGGIVMIAILYLIIAFGIFGTVIMMTAERKKEFSILIAIGMKKRKLALVSITELIILNFLGIISGIIMSLPLVIYFMINPIRMTGENAKSMENMGIEPIMPTTLDSNIYLTQVLIILFITVLALLYPLISIIRLNVIKTIRS